MWSKKFLLLAVLLLAGCQTVSTTPAPTPVIWMAQYTPSLGWMGADLNACTQQQSGIALIVSELPASALQPENSNFALRWGPPASVTGSASVLGEDELVFIVNSSNQVSSLSLQQAQSIYSGNTRSWEQASQSNGEINVWEYPQGSDAQEAFDSVIQPQGQPPSFVQLAPNPSAMVQAVAAEPLAIGFIPRRWLNDSVRTLNLTGVNPASMIQPILALTERTPIGAEKDWLTCLQGKIR